MKKNLELISLVIAAATCLFALLAVPQPYLTGAAIIAALCFVILLGVGMWRFTFQWRNENQQLKAELEILRKTLEEGSGQPGSKNGIDYVTLMETYHHLVHTSRDQITALLDSHAKCRANLRAAQSVREKKIMVERLSDECRKHLDELIDEIRALLQQAAPNNDIWASLRVLEEGRGYVTWTRKGDCIRKERIENTQDIAENDSLPAEMKHRQRTTGNAVIIVSEERPPFWPKGLINDQLMEDQSIVFGPGYFSPPPDVRNAGERELAAILFVNSPQTKVFGPLHEKLMRGCCDVVSLMLNVQLRILRDEEFLQLIR